MEKKITIIDKTFTPIVVRVSVKSAIYEDRGQQYGKQHLLSDTEIVCKAMDGLKEVGTMKAHILQVPTQSVAPSELMWSEDNPLPAKQLAINWLCQHNMNESRLCDMQSRDNVAMVLPITTHLYIDRMDVEPGHRNRGIATGMLDYLISMFVPETICLFAQKEDAEMQVMLKKMKFAEYNIQAYDTPWKKKDLYAKRLKRRAR